MKKSWALFYIYKCILNYLPVIARFSSIKSKAFILSSELTSEFFSLIDDSFLQSHFESATASLTSTILSAFTSPLRTVSSVGFVGSVADVLSYS